MIRCTTCPVPNHLPCIAVARLHQRYCELADPGHPDHLPAIRDDILADSLGKPRAFRPRGPRPAPLSREEIRENLEVETCMHLQGCHCDNSATCARPTRPPSLEGDQWNWPDVGWRDCKRCVHAGEHSPRG